MQDSIKRITLDIHTIQSKEVIYAKQGDTGRQIHFSIVENSVPYSVADCGVVFTAKKLSGKVIFEGCTTENNTVIYDMSEAVTASIGLLNCELQIFGPDGEKIGSPRFTILVDSVVYAVGDEIETGGSATRVLLAPAVSRVGQFFKVAAVDDKGMVARLEAVFLPQPSLEQTDPDEEDYISGSVELKERVDNLEEDVESLNAGLANVEWDNVKHKPFYSIPNSTVVFAEDTLTFTQDEYQRMTVRFVPPPFVPSPGERFRVIWDGELYDVNCENQSDSVDAIGNPDVVDPEDTGLPFCIEFLFQEAANESECPMNFIGKPGETSHTVKITRIEYSYEIKEECLPDAFVERVETLESDVADLMYKPIAINNFTIGTATAEIGSTVENVSLQWTLNKEPKTVTLGDESMSPAILGSKSLAGVNITENTTWTLKATDERGAEATKTVGLTFLNGVYYGVAEMPQTVDSNFIRNNLSKALRSSKLSSFSGNAGAGEYLWYCLPVRMGTCTFKVGGFEGGFILVDTINFTNASGYAEQYHIYRSENAALGSTTVGVS